MKMKHPLKRFHTELHEVNNENHSKLNNLSLQELKIHLGTLHSKSQNDPDPNLKHKRNMPNRLPELQLHNITLKEPNDKIKKNNMFVINSLITMLEEPSKEKKLKHKEPEYINEFAAIFSCSTTKNQRTPKILQNQLTRLSVQSNTVRRKIYSQEKTRIQRTVDDREEDLERLELLTFYGRFSGSNSKTTATRQ